MVPYQNSRDFAEKMDEQDILSDYRERFYIPSGVERKEVIYLCGHALGLQPRSASLAIERELEDWKRLGVEGFDRARNPWLHYHELVKEQLAMIVGARPSEVVPMNSLTVNLHLLLASFYRPMAERSKVLMEANASPSVRFAVQSHIRWHDYDPQRTIIALPPEQDTFILHEELIERALAEEGDSIALILLSGVNHLSGQAMDIKTITQLGHQYGCLVGYDLAYAGGNIILKLHDWEVDFAAICSYRYLNGGPGAIGGCFIRDRHALADTLRLAGWWGHDCDTRFLPHQQFDPLPGAEGWQISNPPILSLAMLRVSLDIFDEIGMERLRAKSLALTGYLEYLLKQWGDKNMTLITPSDPQRRGCQLSLRPTKNVKDICKALKARGIICDVREPNILRVTPVPLYNSFQDVYSCVEHLRAVVNC